MNQLKLHNNQQLEIPSLSELREALEPQDDSPFDREIFERAFEYMQSFQDRELALNHQLSSLSENLDDLGLSMDRLSPLDIAELLEILRKEIENCAAPVTETLQNKLQKLRKLWDRLNFFFFFSIAQELNQDSFQGNFYHRLSLHIENLEKKKSKAASRLKKTLSSLQMQCKAAEEIFCGNGMELYSLLPKNVKLEIEQRLFERRPGLVVKEAKNEEDRELVAAAIMASLSEQMQSVYF